MPLKPCPQCGHKVSPNAASCPSCGHPLADARKKQAENAGGVGCAIAVVGLIGFIAYIANEGGKLRDAEKANPTCVSDYKKCKDNKDIIEHHESKNEIRLSIECKSAAEKLAKYGDPVFPFLSFSQYFLGSSYLTSGTAILIENDAKFKNGFGADENVRVRCDYDLKSDAPSVEIIEK